MTETPQTIASGSWRQLLTQYRVDPVVYGPEIVARMAPAIASAARRLRSPSPALESDDIQQELTLRVLAAAATMKLPGDDRWIPRRLILRARTEVGRWLQTEARRQQWEVSLDAAVETSRPGIAYAFFANGPALTADALIDLAPPDEPDVSSVRHYETARKRRWRARRRYLATHPVRSTHTQPPINPRPSRPRDVPNRTPECGLSSRSTNVQARRPDHGGD